MLMTKLRLYLWYQMTQSKWLLVKNNKLEAEYKEVQLKTDVFDVAYFNAIYGRI